MESAKSIAQDRLRWRHICPPCAPVALGTKVKYSMNWYTVYLYVFSFHVELPIKCVGVHVKLQFKCVDHERTHALVITEILV